MDSLPISKLWFLLECMGTDLSYPLVCAVMTFNKTSKVDSQGLDEVRGSRYVCLLPACME